MNRQPSVLVIGGGIAGIQASLDLADRGMKVYLVEKNPSIGGRMAQLDKTFPTMDCSICILAPKMVECSRHPNITLLTYSEVKNVEGSVGNFVVTVLKKPRYVDEAKCTGCSQCEENCPIEVPNEFDEGLGMRKAIYTPFPQAVPKVATIDKENCIECGLCEKICKAGAVDLNQQPEEIKLNVGAIVVATGFNLFNPSVIKEYGYKEYGNVLTSLELERMVCASGPTGGRLVRPSDGKVPRRIAFIQCVGSRGLHRGLPYCSSACCMYATKEALIIKEHDLECEVYIFYIELKVFGKGFQDFINKAKTEYGVKYIRGRPGEIKENPMTKDLIIRYENTLSKKAEEMKTDLVVLCPAMIPTGGVLAKIFGVELDEHGFFKARDSILKPVDTRVPGIFVCGYCQEPKDIPESVAQASGAAARAAEAIETVTKAAEAIIMVGAT
jgi:heterodisulfide reductase subunit A